ncbi:MAG: hypothetical protein A3B13_02800 [Candidatus Liptonbacteria bacterium RIFCSPLOWO2_01_FULL_45_15]|uniref:Methyltransferase type 11 domain-containing protein n=1 Tax=Candidatus Liptonbacteria bacterium RIFCSPLOWO2_01_FULL_45_15 TaxID=1798649 RepID=A0A1G2CF88_9BACT|nr:MAG: hypothetical protein A3B13_02800 [Candidatus Liptonbacteria bacterium RIFCSPLOWO2_01_FULL_45_15]
MKSHEFSEINDEIVERTIARNTSGGAEKQFVNFNLDPISAETYRRVFDKLIRQGDLIVNIGAGFAVDPTNRLNSLNREVFEACAKKDATLMVLDINHKDLLSHKDLKEIINSKNLQIVEADGLNMPIRDAAVSGIVSGNLINCQDSRMKLEEQADKLIEEARRVLRPGGFLLLSSFGYAAAGKDGQGRNLYNNGLKKEDILTLKRIEEILLSKGFADIAELDIDQENEALLRKNTLLPSEEAGGLIAYKTQN